MKQKLIIPFLLSFLSLFLLACTEEEAEVVLKSETISINGVHFEIPAGFVIAEDKSDDTTIYYESPLHEFSKIIYRTIKNDGSIHTMQANSLLPGLKVQIKETYLANSHPEVIHEERTQLNGHTVYKFLISYNLYDAPMLHSHCYVEDKDILHHIEYIGVEEEGYDTSFASYFDHIRME